MNFIKWVPEAQDDLRRLHAFILPHSSDAADKAISTILSAVDHLGEFPESGKPWDHDTGFREWPVQFGAKGYVVRYRLSDDALIIVRVWHSLEER